MYPKPYSIYLRGTIYRGYVGLIESNMETTRVWDLEFSGLDHQIQALHLHLHSKPSSGYAY